MLQYAYTYQKNLCISFSRISRFYCNPFGEFSQELIFPAMVQEHSRYIWKTLHTWLDPTQLVVCNSWNSFKLLHYPAWKKNTQQRNLHITSFFPSQRTLLTFQNVN